MKAFFAQYKFHLLLLLLGTVWLAVFDLVMQGHWQKFVSPDAGSYLSSAKNLYVYQRGHNYRLILMAAITGIPYLFGASDAAVYVFCDWLNFVCWLGSLLVLLEILNGFLKPRFAFALASLSIFIVGINAMIFELGTENIYLFFMMLGFYLLVRYHKTEKLKFLCLALALFVLSMLIKPGSKIFALLITLYFIRPIIFNYSSKFAWLVYGSYLLVFVQCAGIKYQFGNFTLGYIDAVTYYDYLGAKAEALEQNRPFKEVWLERATYIYSQPYPAQRQIAQADFLHQLQSNTANFIKAYVLNLWENATTGSLQVSLMENVKGTVYFERVKALVFNISLWQNIIGSPTAILLSIWAILRFRSQNFAVAIIGGFILYTMLLSGVSCTEGDRFHVITFPLAIVLLAKLIGQKKTFANR